MNKPIINLFLLFLFLGNSACSQETKKVIIDLSVDSTKPLEFMKDLKPVFSKKISGNKHCFHEVYGNDLYLTSIIDTYQDGKYSNQIFLRKTDFDGNEQWVFVIDEFIKTALKDIMPTDDGVYILYEGYTGRLVRDCYLKKLDIEGKELWTKNFGKKHGTDILDMMKLDANGNPVFVLNENEASILHRISPEGIVLDQATFADEIEFKIADFDFDQNGNIFMIGLITSYPEKKLMHQAFFYKLDSKFNVLKKKVQLFGRITIPNDITFLGAGKFAVKISSDIDFNRPLEKQIVPMYFLLDADLNILNISQISSSKVGTRTVFKTISSDKVISLDHVYLNKRSYHAFHIFDLNMNYQKSILINFNTGITATSILDDGQVLVNKFEEEIIRLDIDFE